jgi:surface antigen
MGFKKIIITATLAIGLTISGYSGAFALDNEEICTAKSYDSYSCVADWGYVGEDPYNVDQFSEGEGNEPKHGCTSFAAYMISLFSPWMPAISHFDSAQYWDTQASSRTPAALSVVPHVGDIAQWNAKGNLTLGHVAYVMSVVRNSSGKLLHIDVADDNGTRKITTQRRLYPGVQTGTIRWPDNFITFPKTLTASGGGGGGGTLINMQSFPLIRG